jgi:uncharacterized protein YbdZ (MbtH family)
MDNPENDWMVIANTEDECAIWAASRPMLPMWRPLGVRGTHAECEVFIHQLDHEVRASVLRQQLERGVIRP